MLFFRRDGFTLVEAVVGIIIIAITASAIMTGVTLYKNKMFKLELKKAAYEELKKYTDYLSSRIKVGDIPKPPREDKTFVFYKNIDDEFQSDKDIYTAKINYDPIEKISAPGSIGKVYSLNTYIYWALEFENPDLFDSLKFQTYQIELNY